MVDSKSMEDLKNAFAGESQANRKYLYFAKLAEKKGLKNIAKIFKAAAEAETIHAHNHLRIILGKVEVKDLVKMAMEGEHYEVTEMYPAMIKDAQAEKNKDAERSFTSAIAAEKVHEKLYKGALDAANADKDAPETKIHVCTVCGMTFEGEAPNECPVCKAKKAMIKEIN